MPSLSTGDQIDYMLRQYVIAQLTTCTVLPFDYVPKTYALCVMNCKVV